jgi:hypothetical protein
MSFYDATLVAPTMLKIRRSAACGLFLGVASHFGGLAKEGGVFPSKDFRAKAHRRINLRLTETAIRLLSMAQAFK